MLPESAYTDIQPAKVIHSYVAGITVTHSSTLGIKTEGTHIHRGVGTTSSPVGNELDVGEFIQIDFDSPQVIAYFILGVLYPFGEFGDRVDETAKVNDGMPTAVGKTQLTLSGFDPGASWVNLEIAQDGNPSLEGPRGGGVWQIINPFGATLISTIRFTAPDVDGVSGGSDFDYTIVNVATIPEPANIFLVGTGLLGLAAIGRKKFFKR